MFFSGNPGWGKVFRIRLANCGNLQYELWLTKGKGNVPLGCLFGGAGFLSDQTFLAPEAKLGHYAAELRTLSVTNHLCGLALTNTTDNPSEMCPLKLTEFCLLLYHQS